MFDDYEFHSQEMETLGDQFVETARTGYLAVDFRADGSFAMMKSEPFIAVRETPELQDAMDVLRSRWGMGLRETDEEVIIKAVIECARRLATLS